MQIYYTYADRDKERGELCLYNSDYQLVAILNREDIAKGLFKHYKHNSLYIQKSE
jgi:hypothetical protein